MKISNVLQQALLHQHELISELVQGLSEEKLNKQPAPGKWSIHQHIAHLTTYQPVFAGRIELIIKENNPAFERYVADQDSDFLNAENELFENNLLKLNNNREIINIFILGLTTDQLQKTGTHPVYGTMGVIDWLRFFILHESHHLFSIYKLSKTFN